MALGMMNKNKKGSVEKLETGDFQDIDESKNKKGRIKKIIILGFIFLSFIALLTSILGFNIFNIRDNYLRGFLESIPIVNNILPPLDSPLDNDTTTQMSNDELLNTIEYLQNRLREYEDEINHLNEINSLQAGEIVRLQEIEENQLQFRSDKEEFDRMIAENDPEAFMSFFKSMYPENAEVLYREAVVYAYQSRELRNYVATFEAMDRRRAGTTLETMMITELELVVLILSSMNVEQRASILGVMSADNAAIIATMMAPESLN